MPVVAKAFMLITKLSLPTFLEDADIQSLSSKGEEDERFLNLHCFLKIFLFQMIVYKLH